MSEKEEGLAQQCIECGINSKSIAHLLTKRNESSHNINWNPTQFTRMRQKRDVLHGLSADATTAENLVKSFENRDDVDFLYVTFHPNDGLMLVKGKEKNFHILIYDLIAVE